MTPRLVAFTTPLPFDPAGFVGGGERYAMSLASGVARAGGGQVAVRIVTFGDTNDEHAVAPGVTMRVIRAAGPAPSRFDRVSWDVGAALEGAGVVHVHQPFTRAGEVAIVAATLSGTPLCLTEHGGPTSRLGASVHLQELADRWLCYSDFARSLLTTDRPVSVVRGGVDGRFFTPPPAPQQRRGFLYVGRLLAHKGVDRLIAALPADLPLTVCGQPHDPEYHRLLLSLAEGKQVEFVADAGDAVLVELYRSAWATILPSVHRDCYGRWHRAPELMGLTLLESMACGTPVVCADTAAMPEFVVEGVTGFVHHTQAELTHALQQLANDAALVETMGANGRKAVEHDYDIAVVGARVLDMYAQMSRA